MTYLTYYVNKFIQLFKNKKSCQFISEYRRGILISERTCIGLSNRTQSHSEHYIVSLKSKDTNNFKNSFSTYCRVITMSYMLKQSLLTFRRKAFGKKVQVGKDQEKAQSEKDSHSKNLGGKKPNQQSGTYTMKHIVSRMSSYFPNRWPLSYLNLTKNMKTYIRRQQHKKIKHQDIKRKEPPQKYRLGTISNTKLLAGLNRFYMAITSPSASAVVHNI